MSECEICFEAFGESRIPYALACCPSKVLCSPCIENIFDIDKSICPYCKRRWNRKRFFGQCRDRRDPEDLLEELRSQGSFDLRENTEILKATAASLGDGLIRADYESAKENYRRERQSQIESDAKLALEMAEGEGPVGGVTNSNNNAASSKEYGKGSRQIERRQSGVGSSGCNKPPLLDIKKAFAASASLSKSHPGQASSSTSSSSSSSSSTMTTTSTSSSSSSFSGPVATMMTESLSPPIKRASGEHKRPCIGLSGTHTEFQRTLKNDWFSWNCKWCTYQNHAALLRCEMCDKERKKTCSGGNSATQSTST